MELALTAGLGPFVAKHRAGVPKLLGALAEQTVLQRRTHHRGRAFRPQGARAVATIAEAVHLLADHIGALADAAAEEIGALQQRCADLAETGTTEVLPSEGFNNLPTLQSFWKQVHHAPEALQLTHDTQCWFSGSVCPLTSGIDAAAGHQIHQRQLPGDAHLAVVALFDMATGGVSESSSPWPILEKVSHGLRNIPW